MHYHPKIDSLPDFESQLLTMPLPDPIASACHCREISDCSNGRRVVQPPAYADETTVVCGRGKGSYNRPANKLFRSLIRSHLPSYLNAPNKYQKGVVIARITNHVEARGLVFVRKSDDPAAAANEEWCELDAKERRDKIGHAIREAVAEQKHKSVRGGGGRGSSNTEQHVTFQDQHVAVHFMSSSDSTISSAQSLDGSEDLANQDLEDRRTRFDRMLESFRMGQTKGTAVRPPEVDGLPFFQV